MQIEYTIQKKGLMHITTYTGFLQFFQIRSKVKIYSVFMAIQCDTPYQQRCQQDVGKYSSNVHNL